MRVIIMEMVNDSDGGMVMTVIIMEMVNDSDGDSNNDTY